MSFAVRGNGARVARLLLLLAAVAAPGCSSSSGGSPGAGGATGQGGGGGGGASGAGGATGAGGAIGGTGGRGGSGTGGRGGSGTGGSGGNPFAGATALVVGANATSGTLADPLKSRGLYSFSGTMGEAIQIVTSTGAANPFDPTYLDLAVTLYGPDQLQIAQQADPWPRVSNAPMLFTALPATGTYYLAVETCTSALLNPCVYPSAVVNHGYTVRVADLGAPTLIREGAEPGNDAVAGAAAVTYTKAGGTSYVPLLLHGYLQSASDRDTFTFTVPTDVPVAAGARARANFWFQPTREDGNGSSYGVGTMYVVDPTDTSGAHIVEIAGTDYGNGNTTDFLPGNMSFPVQLGKQYALVITHSSFSPASNDFYFLQHLGGAPAGAPALEMEPNGTQAMADSLAAIDNMDGTYTFAVDGDLSPPATDVDFHHLQVPAGLTKLTGTCASGRYGSGVAGFQLQLVGADGTVLYQLEELGNADRDIGQFPIPATGFAVRISGSMQFAGITNSSYICQFVATP